MLGKGSASPPKKLDANDMNSVICRNMKLVASAMLVLSGFASAAFAQNYLTDFTKNNDIYTDLNEQFPNTGAGVPGSHMGVANASFLFDPTPSAVEGAGYAPGYVATSNVVNNGIDFDLTSNANGQDFAQIGNGGPLTVFNGPQTLTVAAGLDNVSKVYLLMGAYIAGGPVDFSVTFNGMGGASETFDSINLPDFNGGVGNGSINTSGLGSGSTSYLDQTVFITHDTGGGGSGNSTTGAFNYYDMTEVTFNLDSDVQSSFLTSFTITSDTYETLLFGATANGNLPGSNSVPDESSTVALVAAAAALLLVGQRLGKSGLLKA
jgi:hypothetical protein